VPQEALRARRGLLANVKSALPKVVLSDQCKGAKGRQQLSE